MLTFLKTILIVLLVYFGLKFLWKLSKPYIMRYIGKKVGQKFEQAFEQAKNQQPPRTEPGKTVIDQMPKSQKRSKTTVGEYVDYEEVE